MRGRRPKPTRMKALTGNPGKRPLNPHEPRPEPTAPECPAELSAVARQEWERLTAELTKLNLITHLDRGALATYCAAYALWAEAMVQIQKYGTMVKPPSGYPMQSPYIGLANRQAELMMRISSEFGFTPASRSRISAPPPDQLPLLELVADEYQEEQLEGGGVGQSLASDRPADRPHLHSGIFFPPVGDFRGLRAVCAALCQSTLTKSFAV